MQLIYTVLQEERKRNEYMLERYQKELSQLPKWKLTLKSQKQIHIINGNRLCTKYIDF